MKDQDSLEESKRLRRLHKFSTAARDKIINDPLNDRALLSRSSSNSVEELLRSSKTRNQLLNRLKNEDVNDSQLEHGLRKLREVIVSAYEQNKDDPSFQRDLLDVYQMSYEYYFIKKDYGKLGNIVLKFIFTHLREISAEYAEYADIYILHVSHNEFDMGKCLTLIRSRNKIDDNTRKLLDLSLIFNNHTSCPSRWFELLAKMPESSLAYQFLRDSPAYKEMQKRCFTIVSKCYNQISSEFLLRQWFHCLLSQSELSQHYQTTTTPRGDQIIVFKRSKR